MYERNGYDWGSLGTSWGSDPIPGSPEVLEGVAATYGSSAENLGRAAENLKRLRSGDQTRSEAVEKIMEKALATSGTLLQVQSRYHTISRALNAYAPELREAQRLSIEAAEAAGPAARRRATARTDNEQARWRTVTFDQGARDQALEDYHRTKSEYLAADAEVNAARAKLDAAIKKRNAAGDKAKNDIGDALKDSPLNDSIGDYLSAAWETIKKVTGAVLEWLWDHIDEICLVIDILSVILALTGVGGPVAAALQVLSKAAKVAHVLANIKQGIQLVDYGLQGLRTGNWGPLVSAVVAIGIGKVLGKGIGGKVKGLAKSGAARHSLKVSQKTVAASNKVLKETIRTGNPASTIIANRTATLPIYHPGAPTVAKMVGGTNEYAQMVAPKVNGALSLMKGTDYQRVGPYVDQLNRLSGGLNSTIPSRMENAIATIGGDAAASGTETVVGMGKDVVAPQEKDGLSDTLRRIGVPL